MDHTPDQDDRQRLQDLADLHEASSRRMRLPRGTPAFEEAVAEEQRIIERIRRWASSIPTDPESGPAGRRS